MLSVVMLTLFIDSLGLGIIIPVAPRLICLRHEGSRLVLQL